MSMGVKDDIYLDQYKTVSTMEKLKIKQEYTINSIAIYKYSTEKFASAIHECFTICSHFDWKQYDDGNLNIIKFSHCQVWNS